MSDTPFMTAPEAAQFLKMGLSTLYRLAKEEKIPARRHGGSWRFHRTELEAFDSRRHTPPAREEPFLSPFERARERVRSLKTERMNCDSPESTLQKKGA